MKYLRLIAIALALAGCNYREVTREIGYKGKARMNPWLAAERFSERYDGDVRSLASWTAPEYDDAVWFVPASILSNLTFIRKLEEWTGEGGHLVLLVEHADADTNDWLDHPIEPKLEPALIGMLDRAGIELIDRSFDGGTIRASSVEFGDETFEVEASSTTRVSTAEDDPGVLASVGYGDGRMTVLTDGRLFRNRWIGEKDHAALLDALIVSTDYEGDIGFLRGSGTSLWGLLGRHLWPVLVALALLTILWVWKNLSRFGPVEAVDGVAELRGYDHHLQALGDFQWRLDRASALLAPLRAQIVERGQRMGTRAGRRDDDFFQFLADRADIPRERVHRALTEAAPPDPAVLTRTTGDLQRLLQVLH